MFAFGIRDRRVARERAVEGSQAPPTGASRRQLADHGQFPADRASLIPVTRFQHHRTRGAVEGADHRPMPWVAMT
jgi:hypothetical protein